MPRALSALTLAVHDYDEVITFFTEEPRHEAYGTVVVVLDLYGNKWDLIQRTTP